ncbi:MAG: endonuclease MutS2 [Clostridia bacterium]|nr:endonuclease MutS2 [Clostridia bacterium]
MNTKVYESLEFNKIKNILEKYAVTYMGKEKIAKLEPSTNSLEIERMQAETTEATSYILKQHDIPLSPVSDINQIIKKVEIGGILNISELMKISDILRVSRRLKDSFFNGAIEPETSPILFSHFDTLYTNPKIEDEINRCIKTEDELDDRASQELYKIRKEIKDLETKIKDKLNSILHSSSKYLQDAVVTFRNDRYVIPVKQEHRSEVPGLIHDSSATGSTIFIEPTAVFNLNNDIRELKIKEEQEVERILGLLTQMVMPMTESLSFGMKQIETIDFIFAKGKYSLAINAFPPKFNINSKYCNLKKARHPLIDPDKVVAIDIWFGKDFNSLIITGPNTGGKTVTLKTVGLLALMAQSGLHIPTNEGSELPIFKNIYTDIGDEQSIEQSLSTFSAHMTTLVKILTDITSEDLVLIDEIGSGTDPVEGAAIAMSILEYLHRTNCTTIATTHYSELKTFAIQTSGIENASCEFDVETLRPTYKLLIGIPGKSNAFAISKKLGLKDEILERANEFLTEDNIKFEDVLSDMEHDRRKAQEERELSKKLLKEASQTREKMEQEKTKFEKQKTEILTKAKQQARDLLLDAEEEAKDIIKELTHLKNSKKENANKQAEEKRLALKKSISEIQKDLITPSEKTELKIKPEEIIKGMNVYIPSLDQEATVCKTPDKKGNIQVQSGIVKLNIHISQVEPVKKASTSSSNKVTVNSLVKSKSRDITTEVKLLGMTVDEALPTLEKYLDDAYLSNVGIVRVVHGKGTGALRKAVHDYLRKNPHVRTYRLGVYGEGDSGVTIVEMK